MPVRRHVLATLLALVLGATVVAPAVAGPVDEVIGDVGGTACDATDPSLCLFPFPNDHFTVPDPTTTTGRRISLPLLGMPRTLEGKPADPADWGRNDGFSPGQPITSVVPGLDLARTWGDADDHLTEPDRYLQPDAPMLLIDTTTGQRHPFWSELDQHRDAGNAERTLILRPLVNFQEGHRYVVALRDLRDAAGATIPANPAFAAVRDDRGVAASGLDLGHHSKLEEIIWYLRSLHGVDTEELFLAWDFTVASGDNLAGRVLHVRDEAFAELGDTDLADGIPQGEAPEWSITEVLPNPAEGVAARVRATVQVPNYLANHVRVGDPGYTADAYVPGSRFTYGADGLPVRDTAQPFLTVPFNCDIPTSATATSPARPSYYGHGLIGTRTQYQGASGDVLRRNHNIMYCSADWLGMSTGDLPNIGTILLDIGNFGSLADRGVQGLLNHLYLGRLMRHPEGLAADPAFQRDGVALFRPADLVYDGNSQGGILGGALTAISPDFTTAVLGAVGMNYSTLLNRSVDWEGLYGEGMYASYRDPHVRQLIFGLIQMQWDRIENNGYAQHMTRDPYPNTPVHRVLLHSAYGDHQVANVSAEVMARTVGAAVLQTALPAGRHWSAQPFWGLETFDVADDGGILPRDGSALVYFDSGNQSPPNSNVPADTGQDPHSDPRTDVRSGIQRATFFDTGTIVDVHDGGPAFTTRCRDTAVADHPAC